MQLTTRCTFLIRIPVAVAACSVLGLASNVESEKRFAAKKFISAALKQLWKMAFSPVSLK